MSSYQSYKYADEAKTVELLVNHLEWPDTLAEMIQTRANGLVESLRSGQEQPGAVETFMQQYGLNTKEGLALMTLAEAFLRIPDSATQDALISDRLNAAEWKSKTTDDFLSRFTGFGMSLSKGTLNSLLGKLGAPVIRQSITAAMKLMGQQFVLGQTIEEALRLAKNDRQNRYSFDMLGEGARTAKDAEHYFNLYAHAIEIIGKKPPDCPPGISIKLSALHPRYEFAQKERCVPLITERLQHLCQMAASNNISLTLDAEEADRLDLSLEIFDMTLRSCPKEWQKFGLAVQAYQKRAAPLIEHIMMLAESSGRQIPVRLVKGAYWDTEIKHAQALGLSDFTVFTRKANSDLSYLACAYTMLKHRNLIYPMFGTHNAHTVASILEMSGADRETFEFQRLYGMGQGLYNLIQQDSNVPVSVYAPVGNHKDLLPYLVRRLLENGANSSFVNQLFDPDIQTADLTFDPVHKAWNDEPKRHPQIALPQDLFAKQRVNSNGLDLTDEESIGPVQKQIEALRHRLALSVPENASKEDIDKAFYKAKEALPAWSQNSPERRAEILIKIADTYEKHREELLSLMFKEGKKSYPDAVAEIREAVDFCRYYADRGRSDFKADGFELPGPSGENNKIVLEPRGVFGCISPWNFPLAIFTGQVVAALMAGNTVVAKPAEQTPHIARRAVELMYKAGVPKSSLQLIFGGGSVGELLVNQPQLAGVAFTGSVAAAKSIQCALAEKNSVVVPFIAETGGQNAMIVDSSALLERAIDDIIHSAFGSAGQRCSALRVLFVQEDIAEALLDMLQGAMQELVVGPPGELSTDIPPMIDGAAHNNLMKHKKFLDGAARKIAETPLPDNLQSKDFYFAPVAYELDSLDLLKEEHFGPILHVVRYPTKELESVIQEINHTGFGLTFGIHTRIESRAAFIAQQVNVGNVYVNQRMTGAVVGSQPFGGRGYSGSGPKAGGPLYLPRFATEKVISIDITAHGGNASLVSLED